MPVKLLIKCIGASALLVMIGIYTATSVPAQSGDRIFICHHNGNGTYQLITVPPNATNGHFDAQGNPLHQGDYISPVESCGTATTPTPTVTPGDDPDPVPEPMSVLLFGAGVAGVGYVVRKLRGKGKDEAE